MEETKKKELLKYQVSFHHKQAIRRKIKPQLIDQLQINSHPSLKYKKAFQGVYLDEVQKSIQQQDIKKLKKKLQAQHAKYMFNQNQKFADSKQAALSTSIRDNSFSPIKNKDSYYNQISSVNKKNGSNFIDFAQNKDRKIQQLIDKNYDGGQSFYINHQKYLQNKISKNASLYGILKDQIHWKQYQRNMEKDKKDQENRSFQQYTQGQNEFDLQNKYTKMKIMENLKSELIKQIENQKIKKNQKNRFNYPSISRHNPITNPIEYHIDNPYILKKIQDKAYTNPIR